MCRVKILLAVVMGALVTVRAEAQTGGRAWMDGRGAGSEGTVHGSFGESHSIADPNFSQTITVGIDQDNHTQILNALAVRLPDRVIGTVNQYRGGPNGGYGTGYAEGAGPGMGVDVSGCFLPGPGPGQVTTRATGGCGTSTSARVEMFRPWYGR